MAHYPPLADFTISDSNGPGRLLIQSAEPNWRTALVVRCAFLPLSILTLHPIIPRMKEMLALSDVSSGAPAY